MEFNKFKSLLEYFVTHLETIENKNKDHCGYEKYITPISNFKKTGKGYMGDSIQDQIEKWSDYEQFQVCINISCSYGSYKTNNCYLNWADTWFNVRPRWGNGRIVSLYTTKEEKASAKSELEYKISELGLFDNSQVPNVNLKKFLKILNN